MMLKSCYDEGHKIRTVTNDSGYHEFCDTCGSHACLCR